MRQLAANELATVSGGSEALVMGIVGLAVFTVGLIASIPTRQPICNQVSTPVFDPYTGIYMGDVVDTYCY